MPLFNFVLRPLGAVTPWGKPSARALHWFGLSDGWFWLSVGGQEVLRTREAATDGQLPYVDYHVVRLWEDVVGLLPAILEPVPDDIAAHLDDVDAWQRTIAEMLSESVEDSLKAKGKTWEFVEVGLGWWQKRKLDVMYLRAPPSIRIWRERETIRLCWSSPPEASEFWAPVHGHAALPLAEFLEEVRAFDRAFLDAMAERVRLVTSLGGIPGVRIDLPRLAEEHDERSAWLTSALRRRDEDAETDWRAARMLLSYWASR